MKKLFATNFSAAAANTWLLFLRVAAGAFMLTHGYPKFQMLLSGGEIQFADPFGLGQSASFVLVIFAEFVCSILLILGLATRFATVPLIVAMLVAAFNAHSADPFAKKEMGLLYLLIFITILVFGPGKYSIDGVISGQKRR